MPPTACCPIPGLLGGYRLVHEAMADPRILAYLRAFLDHDVIPLLTAPPGMALGDYRDTVLTRFANPAINDQLPRITSDGGAKIPVFLGDTIRACLARAATTAGSPSCWRRSPAISAASTTGSGVRAAGAAPERGRPRARRRPRPGGRPADQHLQGAGSRGSAAFVASFERYRAMIAEAGRWPTLAAIANGQKR